jgi:alpha-L-fucosidase
MQTDKKGSHTRNRRDGGIRVALALGLLGASPLMAASPPSGDDGSDGGLTREQRIAWWREGRFGLFIHWGLYAIPGGTWGDKVHTEGYSEWIMFDEKIPGATYEKLAGRFNPVRFDAKAWADLARRAGMKYVVLTAKHHDGFSMFDSDLTRYDIVDATPFDRDATGELAAACRAAGLHFGCYYSVDRDWYRPQGPGNKYKQSNTWDYPASTREDFDTYFTNFAQPQVEELLKKYQLDLLWFDGIDMKTDEQAGSLYRSIRRLRPECIINSRIRHCVMPSTTPPLLFDYISTGDNEIAERNLGFEWENPGSMNTSYGYNPNDHTWRSAGQIVVNLVDTVSKGGNYLLNVGPTPEGLIPEPCVERLLEVGEWLKINGEAIYGTSPWRVFRERAAVEGRPEESVDVRFTAKGDAVYVTCLTWPGHGLSVRALGSQGLDGRRVESVALLGAREKIEWRQAEDALTLTAPSVQTGRHAFVYRVDLAPQGRGGNH